MRFLLTRLMRDEQGQDLIEYALLTAGMGFAGIAVWPAITNAIFVAYQAFDADTQDLWVMPDPGEGL